MSPKILDTALDAVGNTPLIRLDRHYGLKCNLREPLHHIDVSFSSR